MSIRAPRPLPKPSTPMIAANGLMHRDWYDYFREIDDASRRVIAMGNPLTVANLPTGTAGDIAFASNGRTNGQGPGAGTGVLVFHDGTAWRACDTGATVAI